MKNLSLVTFLASSIFFFSMSPVQAKKSMQELEKGALDIELIDAAQDYIQAKGIFDAPPNKVWQVLTDFKNYPKYYDSVSQSNIRSQKGNVSNVYVKFDFPFPVGDIAVLNAYTLDKSNMRLSWKMLEGNLKGSDGAGSWSLEPYKGSKTLAVYRLNTNSGGVSNWVQKQAVYKTTPAVFKRLNQFMK